MRGYSEREVFLTSELMLFHRARMMVEAIPDVMTPSSKCNVVPSEIRCHELARAVGAVLGLPVQDGHYYLVDHSWLWASPRRRGQWRGTILDVYCVGSLPMVQLRAEVPGGERRYGFVPGVVRDDIRTEVVEGLTEFFRQVDSGSRSPQTINQNIHERMNIEAPILDDMLRRQGKEGS